MAENQIARGALRLLLLAGAASVSACASGSLRHPDFFGQACNDIPKEGLAVECVTVFYGTNRAIEFTPNAPERVTVQNELADGLTLGVADVWVPLEIRDGETRDRGVEPRPPRDDLPPEEQEHYFYVTRITESGESVFLSTLADAVGRSGEETNRDDDDQSILLFVHGFNVEFEEALIKTAQLSFDLQYPYPPQLNEPQEFDPGVPVSFSWPSQGSLFGYGADEHAAAASDEALREFLRLLLTENLHVERVNIVAHSMGNRVLSQTLSQFAEEFRETHRDRHIEFRVIVAAADVGRAEFAAAAEHFSAYDAEVTIYTSNNDFAMFASRLINRVAETVGLVATRARLGDSDGNNPYVIERDGYATIDTTNVAPPDIGFGHGYYANNEAVLNDTRCELAGVTEGLRELDATTSDENRRYFRTRDPDPGGPPDSSCNLRQPIHSAPRQETRVDGQPPPPPPPPSPPPPPPPPAPVACPAAELVVYFEWDRANLSQAALETIDAGVNRARQCNVGSVVVVGHADTSGGVAYNQGLSDRRAGVVRDALMARGISGGAITTQGRGEADLARATRDGVREPLNRRTSVTILFR